MAYRLHLALLLVLLAACSNNSATPDSQPPADGAVADLTLAADTAKPDTAKPDMFEPDTLKPDVVWGPNTLGPAGGTLTSADGRVSLTVEPGSLSGPVIFTLAPTFNVPLGCVDQPYSLGPAHVTFRGSLTISYDLQALGGVDETMLRTGFVVDNAWQANAASTVDTEKHTVTVSVTHLGDFAVLPPTATPAKVFIVNLKGEDALWMGEHASLPLRGVVLDAQNIPIADAPVTYSVDKSFVTVDAQGNLKASELPPPGTAQDVTVTAKSGSLLATQVVKVKPHTASVVTLTSPFESYQVYTYEMGKSLAPAAGAELIHVQSPTHKVVADSEGKFATLPVLPAGSFFTLRLTAGNNFRDVYASGIAELTNTTLFVKFPSLYSFDFFQSPRCKMDYDRHSTAVLSINSVWVEAAGSIWHVGSPGARVIYESDSFGPDCNLTETGSKGHALVFGVKPGLSWIISRKGAEVSGILYHVGSANAYVEVQTR